MDPQESFKSLKLLSLDGGGVRGLATLLILDNLMRRINHEMPPRPCEYFDLIGGTSTGGLIAIMLGPLGMDVQSCIEAYVQLSKKVFKKRAWKSITRTLRTRGRFDSAELEKAILKIIKDQGKDADTMLFDRANPRPKCRVFVCVTRKANSTNTCFRSYESLRGHNRNCKLWEAARATSAAPTFFDPIAIGPYGEEYVDGATGSNNPVNEVLEEARDIWPNQRIQCFISIGTGIPESKKFGDNLVGLLKTLKGIATETERTAEAFLKAHRELKENNGYFRFNVATGLQTIRLDESEKIGEMAQATDTYLESEGVRVEMEKCVQSLRGSNSSNLADQQRNIEKQETDIDRIDREFKDNFGEIKSWLSPPSYDSDYGNIKAQRTPNTCEWIFERDEFKAWNEGLSRYLWIHGKPGCGKSVIASTVVESLKTVGGGSKESQKRHLGYVFCDKKDETKRDPRAVMKILVWQIVSRNDLLPTQKEMILSAWRAAPDSRALSRSHPGGIQHAVALFEFFERLIAPYLSCSIIIDGLDECEHPGALLDWLLRLTNNSPPIRLLFVSQNVGSVADQYLFDPNRSTIEIKPESTDTDIATYIGTRLPKILTPGTPVYSEVRRVLLNKAQGMFLWVKLAIGRMETISKSYSMESRLSEVAEEFPKGLDEFFVYILERMLKGSEGSQSIDGDSTLIKEDICRALEYVLWSFRPLGIEELQLALRLSTTESTTSQIHESIDSAKFKKQISSLCAPLLQFHGNGTVTIVHSTFLDFMGTKLREIPGFQGFSQPVMVHCKLVTACLRYLKSEDFAYFIGFNILERMFRSMQGSLYPFKDYATRYWWLHLAQQHPLNEACSSQPINREARDFINSDQAITWLESYIQGQPRWSSGSTKYFLSAVERCVGNKGWAIQLLQRALDGRTSQLEEKHQDTLQAQNNLFAVYFLQGSFKQAQRLGLQLLEVRKRVFGEDHPDTLAVMGNLAAVYGRQGRLKEAEELGLQLVEIQKRVSGKEHLDTLQAMHNLVVVYYDQGRFNEAQTIALQLIGIGKRVLGEEHPYTLGAIGSLAEVYCRQGHLKEAEALELQRVEAQKRVSGGEDLVTLEAMIDLARVYGDQGRLEEAKTLILQALEARKRMLGREHPDTLTSMSTLASVHLRQGHLKEAEKLELQALEAWKRIPDWEGPHALNVIGNLSLVYCTQGRLKEAEALGLQVLETRRRRFGEEDLNTLVAMLILASVYQEQRRFGEAETLILHVSESGRRIFGIEHPVTLGGMSNLASLYHDQGHLKEAEDLGLQVLDIQKRIYDVEHLDTLSVMGNLALVYYKQGRLKEAEALGLKVLEARRRVTGEGHPETLTAMGNLALVYEGQGRLEVAEALGLKVLEGRKILLGNEHPVTLKTMSYLAAGYKKLGRLEDAEELNTQVAEATSSAAT